MTDDTRPSARFDATTIEDLRSRLRRTRWDDSAGAGWSLGVDTAYLRDLVRYWADGFDFAAHAAALDALPFETAVVRGLRVSSLHARAHDGALPLLLAHGWPDSGWRYRKVLPLLADPADGGEAYTVVVPDMPGYGFSQAPGAEPFDARAVADMWAELMTQLGYERFGVAGGDIGSYVVRALALEHPDRVVAVHRMDAGLAPLGMPGDDLSDAERDWFARTADWRNAEGAYAMMHRTKPDTAGVGLTDSPAGLAAWVVEKLRAWSDCGGDLESVYTRDEVLGLLTEYWVTATIGPSMRMYQANAAMPRDQVSRRVEVPSGFSLFPGDIVSPPRAWLERTSDVVSVTRPDRGGHFAPFEQPERYAAELRAFFGPYR